MNPTRSEDVPVVTVAEDAEGPMILGWEEFVRWAMFNSPEWNMVAHYCSHLKLDETQSLKIMSSSLLKALAHTKERFMDRIMSNPVPPYVQPKG